MRNLSVTTSVTVRAARTRAFAVFTEKFATWWPASHHIGDAELADAVIEVVRGVGSPNGWAGILESYMLSVG